MDKEREEVIAQLLSTSYGSWNKDDDDEDEEGGSKKRGRKRSKSTELQKQQLERQKELQKEKEALRKLAEAESEEGVEGHRPRERPKRLLAIPSSEIEYSYRSFEGGWRYFYFVVVGCFCCYFCC
jgi:hypothetical protein